MRKEKTEESWVKTLDRDLLFKTAKELSFYINHDLEHLNVTLNIQHQTHEVSNIFAPLFTIKHIIHTMWKTYLSLTLQSNQHWQKYENLIICLKHWDLYDVQYNFKCGCIDVLDITKPLLARSRRQVTSILCFKRILLCFKNRLLCWAHSICCSMRRQPSFKSCFLNSNNITFVWCFANVHVRRSLLKTKKLEKLTHPFLKVGANF